MPTRYAFLLAFLLFQFQIHGQTPTDLPSNALDGIQFRSVGPTRGGRVTSVAGHPVHQATFYMGATGGGLWKTEDYGANWQNISDGYFATGSIGSIALAPSNPKVIYVGTGSDAMRSNVIIGKGIYRSEDGGLSWSHVGLESCGQLGAVIVHPTDPETVYVAAIGNPFRKNTERGVFKSVNGGRDWQKILYHSDSVGAVDLEFAPDDPTQIYACLWRAQRKPWTIISGGQKTGGIYKTEDSGQGWVRLSNGLPQGLIGKSDLAVSPANPHIVWALVEAPAGEGGVFRSDDRGTNFKLVNSKKELLDRPFYYCNIDANPKDAEHLYVSSTRFWHSKDGGQHWSMMSTPHGDNHDLWINPEDTNLFIQANDGGANITQNGGKTWSSLQNQPTAELYQVAVDDQHPYWLYAGQQDNSTIAVPSLPPYQAPSGPKAFWMAVGGCETGPAIPKPGNPDIVYSNCKGRFGVYDKSTGQERQYYVGATNIYGHNPKDLKYRFQRVAPIHISPHDPNTVYHASQYLHKTENDGQNWEIISPDLTAFPEVAQVISGSPITRDITGEEYFSTIYAVAESPILPGTIWVGSNDGLIHITRDAGETWKNVTPSDLPKWGRVQCIEPSRHDSATVYVAIYRYLLGDFTPYLYATTDFGQSWKRLSSGQNGIPADHPSRVIREDPEHPDLLYAGTEFGLFLSMDRGQYWRPFQLNLPATPITDIKLKHGDLILSTMGRSFWILDDVKLLRQWAMTKGRHEHKFFEPTPAFRYRYRRSTGIPTYPPSGMNIDYFLASNQGSGIKIKIYNAEDQLVRSFTNEGGEQQKEEKDDMAMGSSYQSPNTQINNQAGGHRILWDLRHQGFENLKGSMQSGPMVAPGKYRLELILDNETKLVWAPVLSDPRVKAAGITDEDLISQEKLLLEILDARVEADELSKEVKKRIDQTEKHQGIPQELLDIQRALITEEGRYQQPMLNDQLTYLFNMLNRADQLPGEDAYERLEVLKNHLEDLKKRAKFHGI